MQHVNVLVWSNLAIMAVFTDIVIPFASHLFCYA